LIKEALIFVPYLENMMNKLVLALSITLLSACGSQSDQTNTTLNESGSDLTPPDLRYEVVNVYPHDTTSYTEGLLVHDGQLFESTGATDLVPSTRSLFGIVDLKTGKIQVKAELDKKTYFGEGITFLNGKVYQLTWKNKVGFIYDAKTFKKLGEFTIPMEEGWGMTTDGKSLIMDDGSSNITFLDPNGFKITRILGVTDNNGPVHNLNELEYINGFIYANIYQTDYICKIDPSSGRVVGRMDCSNLKKEAALKYSGSEYMNGIAYDSAAKKIYVTGKQWPNIYEIRFTNP
jgi:glutamine cyclotransferase